ncbi:MAG: cytochrome c maturation protein CcmE [Trueperaceae bacterium]
MKKIVYSIAGVAILVFAGFLVYRAMQSGLTYFILPSEYAEHKERYENRRVQLGGVVEPGSVKFIEKDLLLTFNITDTFQTYTVNYTGAPPELFNDNTGVVVEGTFDNDIFVSNVVKVKHSEQYKPPAEGEAVNLEELKETLY